jgi:SpoVK/Ycf46/Vps4 family AAA+-type ATPase
MAAEVLAHMMNLRLFQIDLASVVSKYIGETTRNLSSIFQEAEMTQSLLFFDEADSLFGKRTESKEALDRYANIEVNYLLQRLEVYEGPVILSTNFQKNLDEAFLRRLNELIEFPMPDEEQRKLIWTRHLPTAAPVDNLDIPYLARQFPLSGGNIRNALLSAAYLAAEDKEHIGMKHVLPSIRMEMQKQGRLVMKSDLASYTVTTTAKSEVR